MHGHWVSGWGVADQKKSRGWLKVRGMLGEGELGEEGGGRGGRGRFSVNRFNRWLGPSVIESLNKSNLWTSHVVRVSEKKRKVWKQKNKNCWWNKKKYVFFFPDLWRQLQFHQVKMGVTSRWPQICSLYCDNNKIELFKKIKTKSVRTGFTDYVSRRLQL